jgi:site-specific DNA-adenine methylase
MSKKSKESIPLGCNGNKTTELKLLLPIIESQIDEKSIFVEPFCGSCVVSYAVFKI